MGLIRGRTNGAGELEFYEEGVGTTVAAIDGDGIDRSYLTQRDLVAVPIPLSRFLGVDGGELGTTEDSADLFRAVASNVQTLKGRTPESTTEAAAAIAQVALPGDYVAGETVQIRVSAQFINGSGADAGRASTIDVSAYEQAAGAVSADLCATAAQAFSADDTYEDKTFTITPTNLAPGDLLNVLLTASCVADDANPTQIQIGEVELLYDAK